MPAYDYSCSYCDEVREYRHAMNENFNGITCSTCEVGILAKKLTPPAGTHFKGQGWGKIYRVHTPKEQ